MSENEATIQDIIERASERTMAFMRIEEGESPDTVAAEYVESYMEDVAMVTPDWLQAAKGRMIQAVAANYAVGGVAVTIHNCPCGHRWKEAPQ